VKTPTKRQKVKSQIENASALPTAEIIKQKPAIIIVFRLSRRSVNHKPNKDPAIHPRIALLTETANPFIVGES